MEQICTVKHLEVGRDREREQIGSSERDGDSDHVRNIQWAEAETIGKGNRERMPCDGDSCIMRGNTLILLQLLSLNVIQSYTMYSAIKHSLYGFLSSSSSPPLYLFLSVSSASSLAHFVFRIIQELCTVILNNAASV